jgi:putative holliday junction resolvase
MARVLAIDYGKKRTGLAVTDPLKIVVNPLPTLETDRLMDFLNLYTNSENVEKIVIGKPGFEGCEAHIEREIQSLFATLRRNFPQIDIVYQDENFTSLRAKEILMITAKKSQRRDKKLVDKVSAVLILQSYLQHI